MNLLQLLQRRLLAALQDLVPEPTSYAGLVKAAQDPRHGDYQANCAMPLAKVLGKPPREVAQAIVDRLDWHDLTEPPEIAGPGFINFKLRPDWLAGQLQELANNERLGLPPIPTPQTLIIDFSSPNVAKPLHVGHLRSTIIGDALARLFRFLGHRVITDNHLGDWGTQFGILLYGYKHFRDDSALAKQPLRELERLYLHVRSLMKTEEEDAADDPVAEAARKETARLHAGDQENLELWRRFQPWCREEIDQLYRRLDVVFDHMTGESFYNPMLPDIVRDLKHKGLAVESQGALAVFLEEGQPPALVQKSDGAYTYTTTDLATLRYRLETWHPDTILYVVGATQALHFKHLFEIASRWGVGQMKLEHVSFGSVLGQDRKLFATRKGGAIELGALLDEAVERGAQAYEQTRAERRERGEEVPDLGAEERRQIAEAVGLGAVKYADLSQNRTSDYVFNWDKMLAMEGNTATYLQYQYARIRNIFRKGEVDVERLRAETPAVLLGHPAEWALAVQILRLSETLEAAAAEYKPNIITAYLYDVAKHYSVFYNTCPVLKAESPELRSSRLLLCDLTARVIQLCLSLLGIRTVERM
jgi:arginyl-tRNA synthetase